MNSFVTISSEQLEKLAKETISFVEKSREETKQKLIQDRLERVNGGFWHQLLKIKDITHEAAKFYFENEGAHDGIPSYFKLVVNRLFDVEKEVAKKLLCACSMAEEVDVSVDDLYNVMRYSECEIQKESHSED